MPSIGNYVRSLVSDYLWYARTLVSEIRIVPHRIRMLHRKTNDPIDLGPLYERSPSGHLLPCKATIARTQYVEFLLARYPWVSEADVLLALDGWDKGTEGFLNSRDTGSMDESAAARDQYPLALSHQ
jgi:hypothetical protein